MFWSFVIALILAALAVCGWVLAELELRDTQKLLDQTELDLAEAMGVTTYPTLHAIDGGGA